MLARFCDGCGGIGGHFRVVRVAYRLVDDRVTFGLDQPRFTQTLVRTNCVTSITARSPLGPPAEASEGIRAKNDSVKNDKVMWVSFIMNAPVGRKFRRTSERRAGK